MDLARLKIKLAEDPSLQVLVDRATFCGPLVCSDHRSTPLCIVELNVLTAPPSPLPCCIWGSGTDIHR